MRNRFVVPWVTVVAVVLTLLVLGKHFSLMSHPSLAYDKVLHFLGGSACGIFGAAVVVFGEWQNVLGVADPLCDRKVHNVRIWISSLFWTLAIGGGWEVLQAYLPAMRDASDYDWYDTLGDLIFDTMGGVAAGLVYQEKK